jgi:hypothetical protein
MTAAVKLALDSCLSSGPIDGIVISTEPKAHHIYLKWAIFNNIPVLMDKPISIPKDLNTSSSAAQQLLTDFLDCKRQILAQKGTPVGFIHFITIQSFIHPCLLGYTRARM